jgi:hypothetical protein
VEGTEDCGGATREELEGVAAAGLFIGVEARASEWRRSSSASVSTAGHAARIGTNAEVEGAGVGAGGRFCPLWAAAAAAWASWARARVAGLGLGGVARWERPGRGAASLVGHGLAWRLGPEEELGRARGLGRGKARVGAGPRGGEGCWDGWAKCARWAVCGRLCGWAKGQGGELKRRE